MTARSLVMRVRSSEAAVSAPPPTDLPTSAPGEIAPAVAPSGFAGVLRRFVHDLDRSQDAMHGLMRSASAGDLDAGQLIALQAGAYRYSEVIDVASRLVDRATGAIKTVLQAGGQ